MSYSVCICMPVCLLFASFAPQKTLWCDLETSIQTNATLDLGRGKYRVDWHQEVGGLLTLLSVNILEILEMGGLSTSKWMLRRPNTLSNSNH